MSKTMFVEGKYVAKLSAKSKLLQCGCMVLFSYVYGEGFQFHITQISRIMGRGRGSGRVVLHVREIFTIHALLYIIVM